MNHIDWRETNASAGPNTIYGYWEDAKCFSIHTELVVRPLNAHVENRPTRPARYILKSSLPGFRPDLPMQANVVDAKLFAERMLQRWVAKRGLLFKSHIEVTDAMKKAAHEAMFDSHGFLNPATPEYLGRAIEAALQAREPHAPMKRTLG